MAECFMSQYGRLEPCKPCYFDKYVRSEMSNIESVCRLGRILLRILFNLSVIAPSAFHFRIFQFDKLA